MVKLGQEVLGHGTWGNMANDSNALERKKKMGGWRGKVKMRRSHEININHQNLLKITEIASYGISEFPCVSTRSPNSDSLTINIRTSHYSIVLPGLSLCKPPKLYLRRGTTDIIIYITSSEIRCSHPNWFIWNGPIRIEDTLPTKTVLSRDNFSIQVSSRASIRKDKLPLRRREMTNRGSIYVQNDIKMSSRAIHLIRWSGKE